ncbi:MAG: hypothetical protein IKU29_02060 [Parabacteroides sp.]|nr:hypothetical protein [Parabacteroides sp.]
MSKKVTTKIYKLLEKLNPEQPKRTTFEEAWDIFSKEFGLDLDIYTDVKDVTVITLSRNEEELDTYTLTDVFKNGDWDWDVILKMVMEDVIRKKYYKFKKQKKFQKKENPPTPKEESSMLTIDVIKKRKQQLYMKIRNWKAKGKSTKELELEYNEIVNMLKNIR